MRLLRFCSASSFFSSLSGAEMAGYSVKALDQKLGIKLEMKAAIVGALRGYRGPFLRAWFSCAWEMAWISSSSLRVAAGLVDVKVCAIDEDWSGLKFVIPVKDRR